MTPALGHFVKLDEFSKKALELPTIGKWPKSRQFKRMLEGKEPLELRSVTAHYFNELDREEYDGPYQSYIKHAYSEVIEEIDQHFIDNGVDKTHYVDTFHKKISKVITQLKVNTSLKLLKAKYKNIDKSLKHGDYFKHNKLVLRDFLKMLRAWIGQLVMLQRYVNKKYEPYTRKEVVPEAKVSPLLVHTNDLRSLFKDPSKYDSLTEFMVSRGKLKQMEGNLIWLGPKYRLTAFHETLYINGFLTRKVSDPELRVRASNTYFEFTVSDRTLRSPLGKSWDEFTVLLSEFKATLK